MTLNLSNNKLNSLPSAIWSAPKLQELNVSLNLISELPPLSAAEEESVEVLSPNPSMLKLADPPLPTARAEERILVHHGVWRHSLKILSAQETLGRDEESGSGGDGSSLKAKSPLLVLNLSHNSFGN